MTLKEAHELQRRELISLRAKVARLEKQTTGLFLVDEKEKLESKNRSLQNQVNSLESKLSSTRSEYSQSLRNYENIQKDLNLKIVELEDKIKELTVANELLLSRATKAEEEVALLNGTNKKLNKKLNTDHENSSLPSSALPFRKKVHNSRKPSGKKPGGQKGHKAHTASKLSPTKEPVIIPAPDSFINNPDFYPTGNKITKQLIDISISVNVTNYVTDEYRNRKTGARCHAPFPPGIVNDVNYGSSLKAFAFLLNNYYNVSISKTKQCISDITKGIVNISTGTICNLSSEFSAATEAERAKIFSLLTHSDVLYSDATVSNVNGKRKTVIVCTNKDQVLYQHVDHKGHDGLSQTPVNNFEGTIIHDHDKTYYSYGSSHQECLAHVLRYLIGATELEPGLTWHKQMHELIQKMIHTSKNNKSVIPKDTIKALTDKYNAILEIASKEYDENPPDRYFMDGFNLYKRLSAYKKEHLYFLSHTEIDYTNNISERQLRKFKRKQKQAVVLRSDSGGQHICDALSIIETAKMQKRNVYDTVEAAFKK